MQNGWIVLVPNWAMVGFGIIKAPKAQEQSPFHLHSLKGCWGQSELEWKICTRFRALKSLKYSQKCKKIGPRNIILCFLSRSKRTTILWSLRGWNASHADLKKSILTKTRWGQSSCFWASFLFISSKYRDFHVMWKRRLWGVIFLKSKDNVIEATDV